MLTAELPKDFTGNHYGNKNSLWGQALSMSLIKYQSPSAFVSSCIILHKQDPERRGPGGKHLSSAAGLQPENRKHKCNVTTAHRSSSPGPPHCNSLSGLLPALGLNTMSPSKRNRKRSALPLGCLNRGRDGCAH